MKNYPGITSWRKASALIASCLLIIGSANTVFAGAIGYGANATGGAGGTTVTVSTLAQYESAVTASGPSIVQVSGTVSGVPNSSSANVAPYKTITGTGTHPTIIGCVRLYPSNHVIVQNLFISSTITGGSDGNDGITIKNGAHDIWVDHCSIYDCADGSIDVTYQSNNVTISWCKFSYTTNHNHDFVNLIGADDSDPDSGYLNTTFHHNWYSTLCVERQPRTRFGHVHVFNNYYSCTGDHYCIQVAYQSQVLAENNYFDNVTNAWYYYSGDSSAGKIKATGSVFVNTATPTGGNDSVFTPPYSYTLDAGSNVKSIVTSGAGCPL